MLRNEMHHKGSVKFISASINCGKYSTSSICSPRMICEILPCFYHLFGKSPRTACNYLILFYSVSDYINQRKIINQQG